MSRCCALASGYERWSALAPTRKQPSAELPLPWPAPDVRLRGVVEEVGVAPAAAVQVPSLAAPLGGEHTISVSEAPSHLALVASREQTEIGVPADDAPASTALAMLVASRAAAMREEAGALTFHASAVVREDRGVLIVGPALAGKTGLALQLAGRGWSVFASNVALVASSGLLLAGTRAVTVRDASTGRSGSGDPFALRLERYVEALPPAPLAAILLTSSAPGAVLFARAGEAALDLLNAASELPRRCVALSASVVDVGIDTAVQAAIRFGLCSQLAMRVPVWRVSGEPVAIANWIEEQWR